MNVAVTVVIPAYNASQYLAESINSVLKQSIVNFELLIIDDGSTDDTADIANRYVHADERVKLISQSNRGVSAARNFGIQSAHGELIAFLDADDWWLEKKLALHLQHFSSNPNLAISYGRVGFLRPNGDAMKGISNAPLKVLSPHIFLYENPTITTSNLVVRKEVFDQVGYFDESMSYNEDLEWCFRAACSTDWAIEGIDQILVQYRTTEGGLSSDLHQMEAGWEALVSRAKKRMPDLVEQHYAAARATHLRYLARRAIRLKLPPSVALNFMNSAIQSDWKLILREPRRTILTMAVIYGKALIRK